MLAEGRHSAQDAGRLGPVQDGPGGPSRSAPSSAVSPCQCWCERGRSVEDLVLFFSPHLSDEDEHFSCFTEPLQPLPSNRWVWPAQAAGECRVCEGA